MSKPGNYKEMYENLAKLNEDNKFIKLFGKYTDDRKSHKIKNKELVDSIKLLTIDKFLGDLDDALKVDKNYYKTRNKDYHVKVIGIEVDGSCDLLRGGFNAEDIGVYIHFIEVIKEGVNRYSIPINSFTYRLHRGHNQLVKCTKDEFEEYYNKALEFINSTYDPKFTVKDYVKFFEGEFRIENKYTKLFKPYADKIMSKDDK